MGSKLQQWMEGGSISRRKELDPLQSTLFHVGDTICNNNVDGSSGIVETSIHKLQSSLQNTTLESNDIVDSSSVTSDHVFFGNKEDSDGQLKMIPSEPWKDEFISHEEARIQNDAFVLQIMDNIQSKLDNYAQDNVSSQSPLNQSCGVQKQLDAAQYAGQYSASSKFSSRECCRTLGKHSPQLGNRGSRFSGNCGINMNPANFYYDPYQNWVESSYSEIGFGLTQHRSALESSFSTDCSIDSPKPCSQSFPLFQDQQSLSNGIIETSELNYGSFTITNEFLSGSQSVYTYDLIHCTLKSISQQLTGGFPAEGNQAETENANLVRNTSSKLNSFEAHSKEKLTQWLLIIRQFQDFLMKPMNEFTQKQNDSIIDLSCTLEKQVLHLIVGCHQARDVCSPFFIQRQQDANNFFKTRGLPFCRYVWCGTLPKRDYMGAVFSCKIFFGGLPYDVTEAEIAQTFKDFGFVHVDWPRNDVGAPLKKGYAYVTFEDESQVRKLLENCTRDLNFEGKWFYHISSKKSHMKSVQVIPWVISHSNFTLRPTCRLNPKLTIFVGALHGMLTAEALAMIMEEVFGGVVHSGIDTDRTSYPIGSARITFDNYSSYFTAIKSGFIEIRSREWSKILQLDPYLEYSACNVCDRQQGLYFCRELECFKYYCKRCFELCHSTDDLKAHRPLSKTPKRKNLNSMNGEGWSIGYSSPVPQSTPSTRWSNPHQS